MNKQHKCISSSLSDVSVSNCVRVNNGTILCRHSDRNNIYETLPFLKPGCCRYTPMLNSCVDLKAGTLSAHEYCISSPFASRGGGGGGGCVEEGFLKVFFKFPFSFVKCFCFYTERPLSGPRVFFFFSFCWGGGGGVLWYLRVAFSKVFFKFPLAFAKCFSCAGV